MEAITQLAHVMAAREGAYALLIGSGVSRPAGVPTGWDVVLRLIESVAHSVGEDAGPDPLPWYRQRYGQEPVYDSLLEALYPSPEDRFGALRQYFERVPDEVDPVRLRPTEAHRAIARLLATRVVRVVVTTNFDRLLEDSLTELGFHANVLWTPAQVEGALPLQHAGATILKIHGDYRDARLRNTRGELSSYSGAEATFLRRVFDEYGLVIVGWSGDWDPALRDAITASPTRRFTTFFAAHEGNISGPASELIRLRDAVTVKISSADSFFTEVAGAIDAIRDGRASDARDTQLLRRRIQRLVDEKRRADLFGLTMRIAEDTRTALERFDTGRSAPEPTPAERWRRLEQYEAATEVLVALTAASSFHDPEPASAHGGAPYLRALAAINAPPVPGHIPHLHGSRDPEGRLYWPQFRSYPTIALYYGIGVAACAAARFQRLGTLHRFTLGIGPGEAPAVVALNPVKFAPARFFPYPADGNPAGARLREWLWKVALGPILHDRRTYLRAFDEFELLTNLSWHLGGNREGFAWLPTAFVSVVHRENHVLQTLLETADNDPAAPWQAALPVRATREDVEHFLDWIPEVVRGR